MLNNCSITGNREEGVYSTLGCGVTLENCTITNNGGHGLSKYYTRDALPDSAVRDCGDYYTTRLINCLVAQNGGYGLYVSVDPVLVNCTIADNSLGGIFSERKHYTPLYSEPFWECDRLPILSNCVLWGDNTVEMAWKYFQGDQEDAEWYYELDHIETPPRGEGLTLRYSCVQGGWPDAGNTDANPLFVDPGSGDYHLQAGSPCIDSGSNEAARDILLDLDGRIRIWNGQVDMGAYEFGSWTPEGLRCDLNSDGRIDHLDLFLFHQSWHKSIPPIPTP